MIALIFRPLMPPLSLISLTNSLIAFVCSVNSTSPANPSCDDSACRFTTGNTTLMDLAVTPRVLVLAWPTGGPGAGVFASGTAPTVPVTDAASRTVRPPSDAVAGPDGG